MPPDLMDTSKGAYLYNWLIREAFEIEPREMFYSSARCYSMRGYQSWTNSRHSRSDLVSDSRCI
jgi:hypothetical protein